MQRHRWKRQKPGFDRSVDNDLLAQNAACLIFEVATEVGPVDEIGNQKRRKERHNQQSAQKNQYASEHDPSSPIITAEN